MGKKLTPITGVRPGDRIKVPVDGKATWCTVAKAWTGKTLVRIEFTDGDVVVYNDIVLVPCKPMDREKYDCPDWCERLDHAADLVDENNPPLHYGPEFAHLAVTQVGAGPPKVRDDSITFTTPEELRALARDAKIAAGWLEVGAMTSFIDPLVCPEWCVDRDKDVHRAGETAALTIHDGRVTFTHYGPEWGPAGEPWFQAIGEVDVLASTMRTFIFVTDSMGAMETSSPAEVLAIADAARAAGEWMGAHR